MSGNTVTVTRTSRVTGRDKSRVTSGVTQRVSHATTTTPHHTYTVVTVVCGVSGSDQIQSSRHLGSLAAPIGIGAMA